MNTNLAIKLAESHQYIIVTNGFNPDGTNKYVLRKVQSASAIKIGVEFLWCINFLESIENNCTGVSLEHIVSYSSNGLIYPNQITDIKHRGIHTPKCNTKLKLARKELKRISHILTIDLKTCQEKIERVMKESKLSSHATLIDTTERRITINSYKSESNLSKALKICARFNKYNMCNQAQAIMSKCNVEMVFQF